MFVLVGQVLNARGRFGPMMWAPIANNLISVVVLVVYLVAFGPAEGAGLVGGFSQREELVLGLGSTLGIAAQLLVLVPYLRAAGFHYRPRFDFRGTGLGHTMRLATWTVLFVIVNQVAYTVVVRLASAGTAEAAAGGDPGTGYTIYSGAFLLVMVPHSIVTVSLTTAVLPRLSAQAADGDHPGVAASVASTLRTTLAMVVPFAVLLPLLAPDLSNIVWGYLAAKENVDDYARSLALFAPGLVFFTTHYLVLRGFYALERNRTVFWVQCVIAAVNVALALAFTSMGPPAETAPSLVLAYVGAYLIGAAVSYFLLARLLGGLQTPVLVRFLVRLLLAAGPAMLLTWAARALLTATWEGDDTKLRSLVVLVVLAVVGGCVFLAAARAMRITEVTSVVRLLTSRVRR
jgi:putative peptidoglycan lipid II flippase